MMWEKVQPLSTLAVGPEAEGAGQVDPGRGPAASCLWEEEVLDPS